MATNRHRTATAVLSAWIEPELRDQARLEAKASGLTFSAFIERAVLRAVELARFERAQRDQVASKHAAGIGREHG